MHNSLKRRLLSFSNFSLLIIYISISSIDLAYAGGGSGLAAGQTSLPQFELIDSSGTPKVVGPVFVSNANSALVILDYNGCPVPLSLFQGELRTSLGGYFESNDCTGQPYLRSPNGLNTSIFGSTCGYFLVDDNNAVYQLFAGTTNSSSITLNSRFNSGTCNSWGPEMWNANTLPAANSTPVGDLDTLFTPPFSID